MGRLNKCKLKVLISGKKFFIRHYKHKRIGNVENITYQKYAFVTSASQCKSPNAKNFTVKHKTLNPF